MKCIIILTKAFPASTLGTNKISVFPATSFLIFLILAAFSETELSKASGPKTSASMFSNLALLVISLASIELGTLSNTSSVADNIDTLGFLIPILFAKLTEFFKICILVSNFGKTFNAPSVTMKGLSFFSIVICQT